MKGSFSKATGLFLATALLAVHAQARIAHSEPPIDEVIELVRESFVAAGKGAESAESALQSLSRGDSWTTQSQVCFELGGFASNLSALEQQMYRLPSFFPAQLKAKAEEIALEASIISSRGESAARKFCNTQLAEIAAYEPTPTAAETLERISEVDPLLRDSMQKIYDLVDEAFYPDLDVSQD